MIILFNGSWVTDEGWSLRWRDRGREPELAPPPYEQGNWVHPDVCDVHRQPL